MKFSDDFLDEIRSRISISDVVGRSVKLTKRGREYVGLSPFNKEKTPSFTVNDQKGFYHCFSSGKHGDIFRFLTETEGLKFPEAVERLAGEAGIPMPQPTREEQQRQERRKDLYEVMDAACRWFETQLYGPNGTIGLSYFRDRGLDDATIKRFRLGFSLDSRDALKTALKSQGISEQQLEAAGLMKRPDDGRPPFDYFRGRVMFPITDRNERVIAFGARTLGDSQPKYLNSPDTDLFHKGSVLYGLATARKAAFDVGQVLVCEGYMDVIALGQFGINHAVAPLGTAITERQIQELWKLAPEPVICLDGDKAGRRAARRAAERALEILKPGHSLRFALMPEGDDPDTLVRRAGPKALDDILSGTTPLADLLAQEILSATPATAPPEQRAGAEKALKDLAFQIQDETVRGHYLKYFRDQTWTHFNGARGQQSQRDRSGSSYQRHLRRTGTFRRWQPPETPLQQRDVALSEHAWEATLLNIMLKVPAIISEVAEDAATLSLSNETLDSLLRAVLEASSWHKTLDAETLNTHLSDAGYADHVTYLTRSRAVHALRLPNIEDLGDPGISAPHSDDDTPQETSMPTHDPQAAVQAWRDVYALHRRMAIEQDLKQAERAFAETPDEESWARLSGLRKARDDLIAASRA